MKRIIHPLLLLIARATEKDLVLYIEYLKAENRIRRSKLPKRVEVTPAERATLTKLGVRLGSTTDSTPTNLPAAANDISSSPSLALVSPASCKTLCDGRAFFIARSIVRIQTAYGRFLRKCSYSGYG
jgi:hypothetical protein